MEYEIYDTKAKCRVGKLYSNRSAARRRADKLDQTYGAYRYVVREVRAER